MRRWLRNHRLIAAVLWTALTLAVVEGVLAVYYLDTWMVMPTL